MGVVREEDRIVVDYEKSVLQVYFDFIGVSINNEPTTVLNPGQKQLVDAAAHYVELGSLMGIDNYILQGVLRMMWLRFTVHKHEALTAMGLEKANQVCGQTHWWYECNGDWHDFCCRPLSDSEHSVIFNFVERNYEGR
ncbi:hypothetical protein IG631_13013 [Alternaria alternata]|nr:hypothetical protein IG631_13013 [Alternaria alternata]